MNNIKEPELYYYKRRAIEFEDAFHNIRYQYQNLRAELEKEKEKTSDLQNIINRLMSELSSLTDLLHESNVEIVKLKSKSSASK